MLAERERIGFRPGKFAAVAIGFVFLCGGAWVFWIPQDDEAKIIIKPIPIAVENGTNLLVQIEVQNQGKSAIEFQVGGNGPVALVRFADGSGEGEGLGAFAPYSLLLDSGSRYIGKGIIPVSTNAFKIGMTVSHLSNGSRLLGHPHSPYFLGQPFIFLFGREYDRRKMVWSESVTVTNWVELGSKQHKQTPSHL